jgi:NhaC family Na+:H+ antiporter
MLIFVHSLNIFWYSIESESGSHMSNDTGQIKNEPTLGQALTPVALLVGLLASSVYLFGDSSSSGPNQIALILAAGLTILIGLRNGYTWKEMEQGMVHGISLAMGALMILLAVGSLIGTWILAGIVPTMIYYGLQILSPTIFYAAATVICGLVALATGSSWTTASTIGIGLMGIAVTQDLNLGLAAGAIISGAYFGDKLSPLSDTTNLAPAMAGADLFIHIRHMLWTTTPSFILALGFFIIAGFVGAQPQPADNLDIVLRALDAQFSIGIHLLLPAVLVIVLVIKRMPAFPAILLGALVGGLFAAVFQQATVLTYVGETDLPRNVAVLKGVWIAMFDGFVLNSGNAMLDELLSRGGMSSMLWTIWLIMAAMMFGGAMEASRMLQRIALGILSFVRGTGSLIAATIATCIGTNIVASDQYISIVLPGRMLRAEYRKRRLHPKNLSRTLEDAGTLTSPLIPWNTCGAFMSQALGVATLTYLPFCFFNLISPFVSAIYGYTGFTIEKLEESDEDEESAVA